jgi:hypothetical protein
MAHRLNGYSTSRSVTIGAAFETVRLIDCDYIPAGLSAIKPSGAEGKIALLPGR